MIDFSSELAVRRSFGDLSDVEIERFSIITSIVNACDIGIFYIKQRIHHDDNVDWLNNNGYELTLLGEKTFVINWENE